MADYDYLLKILLIGSSGVGKSCILLRFVDNDYAESFISTIGVDFKIKTVEIGGKIVKLQIWDTAGQERFRTITSSYYRGAYIVMLVYDVTDEESFTELRGWFDEAETHCTPGVTKYVIGNKCDLIGKRVVEHARAQEFCNSREVPYIETSAKQNTNIEKAFIDSATMCLDKIRANGTGAFKPKTTPGVGISNKPVNQANSGCAC